MNEVPSGQEAINRRAWPRDRQVRAAAAATGLVQARVNRYADTAALFQALGGSIAPPVTHP
jgi:hypothetical protein